MSEFMYELSREFRRNMRGITDFCFPTYDCVEDDYGPPNMAMALSPVIYAIGAIEPLVETPVRYLIKVQKSKYDTL